MIIPLEVKITTDSSVEVKQNNIIDYNNHVVSSENVSDWKNRKRF